MPIHIRLYWTRSSLDAFQLHKVPPPHWRPQVAQFPFISSFICRQARVNRIRKSTLCTNWSPFCTNKMVKNQIWREFYLRMIFIRHYRAVYGLLVFQSFDFSHRLRFLEGPIRFLVKAKLGIPLGVLNPQISREALVSKYLKISHRWSDTIPYSCCLHDKAWNRELWTDPDCPYPRQTFGDKHKRAQYSTNPGHNRTYSKSEIPDTCREKFQWDQIWERICTRDEKFANERNSITPRIWQDQD